MNTKALLLLAFGSVSMLSADQYSSCPGGNCPYQGQSSGQPYYQGQSSGQPYYQGQSSSQSYYQGNPQQNYRQPSNQYQNNAPRTNQNTNQDREGYYNPSSSSNFNSSSSNTNNNSSLNRSNINNSNASSYVNDDKNAPKTTKIITDEEIAEKVHDAVGANWLSSGYPDVTFDVNNGTVNLRGYVKTQDEKIKLENALKKIEGVKQVNSEVSVGEAKSANNSNNKKNSYFANNDSKIQKAEKNYPQDKAVSDSDRLINSKIRSKLSGWFTQGYETIVLNTSNGVVTITGFVEKVDDIQKINKDAKAVDGVKTVNNNVTLQKK